MTELFRISNLRLTKVA